MSRPAGTNYIEQWAAYCAAHGISFYSFSCGVEAFIDDPSWIDAGWERLANAVAYNMDPEYTHSKRSVSDNPYYPFSSYAEWADAYGHPDRLKSINNKTISPQGRAAIDEMIDLWDNPDG